MNYLDDCPKEPAPLDYGNSVALLSSVYLDAGLPLELAVRAAIADLTLFGN